MMLAKQLPNCLCTKCLRVLGGRVFNAIQDAEGEDE